MRNSKKNFWVASSSNDWMNEELTLCYVDEVLRRFAFSWQLWYGTPFEFHIMDSACAKLGEIKFKCTIVLGSFRKYIQANDVYVNQPFKECMTEKYDEWLAKQHPQTMVYFVF